VELRWLPLGKIGASLLVPADHPLAKLKKAPTPRDVARHPLIVHERRSPSRKLTERVFREYGSHLQIAAEVTFAQTMRAMVRSGVAPAFVPHLISSGSSSGSPRGLPNEAGTRTFDVSPRLKGGGLPFGLLYRSGTEESATFKVFRDAMVELWG
jgi:DNA-binding transcriptional LysR family regulator